MLNLITRCTIMYIFVIASVRLMGKRQIGELQPSELVITILISDVASMPLQNSDIPTMNSIMCLLLLVLFEVVISILSIRFRKIRKVLQGNSMMIIEDGELKEGRMKLIRYTVDDLMEALRLKDCFDISQVQYAYIETNGSISVKLKPDFRPVVAKDLGVENKSTSIPCLVICDGEIIDKEFEVCKMSGERLKNQLDRLGITAEQVFILTTDSEGKSYLKLKEEK